MTLSHGVNELSSGSQGGTLTVAGATGEGSSNYVGNGAYSVKVNAVNAPVNDDGTFAASGFTPGSGPNTNTYTAIGPTAADAAGAAIIAGELFTAAAKDDALNQASAGCNKSPHSPNGSCWCCVMYFTTLQNGPESVVLTSGYGYVEREPCSQAQADDENTPGISAQGSIPIYEPW